MKVNRGLLRGLVVAAASAALIVPSAAFAQGPGNGHGAGGGRGGGVGGGRGNGGGGGPGEETAGNNLSVPTIFVPNVGTFPVSCGDGTPGGLVEPTGTPLTGYEEPGYYYVQGIHTWQSQCETAGTASATPEWSANLVGTETSILKVGKPIRVEVALVDNSGVEMNGYTVIKLDTSELDRVSPYGTLATPTGTGGYTATETTFPTSTVGVGVWTADAHLKIFPLGEPGSPVVDQAATAEINSGGRVVYGYNLRVDTAGTYVIDFTTPAGVALKEGANGTVTTNPDGTHTASLEIEVGSGAGGGGGGGHGPGGGGGG